MDAQFIRPSIDYESSYRSYIEELGEEERYPYPLDLDYQDFPALIKTLEDYSHGKKLPSWLVPNTTYWLVKDQELIGVSHLRHYLNAALFEAGGHIGLGIRPSFRRKGYSKLLLKLTIEQAKAKDISEVHVHCHKNNIASVKMIISCGGNFNSEIKENNGKIVNRYVINVS